MGKKFDTGKIDWALLPLKPIEWVIIVLMHGAKKYGRSNWQTLPDFEDRYFSALMRHLTDYRSGETYDKDSGLHHLAHVACNIVFLIWGEIAKGVRLHKK